MVLCVNFIDGWRQVEADRLVGHYWRKMRLLQTTKAYSNRRVEILRSQEFRRHYVSIESLGVNCPWRNSKTHGGDEALLQLG